MTGTSARTAGALLALATTFGATIAGGCDEMQEQARLDALEASPVFHDGRGARDLVPGVVARDAEIDETTPDRSPWPTTRAFLDRGRERYDIYCAVCHDRAGTGGGMIVLRGFPRPTSFADPEQRALADAAIHDAVADGAGTMPAFRARIRAHDRWAIVAYVRALQLARHADLDAVPAAERARLEAAPR